MNLWSVRWNNRQIKWANRSKILGTGHDSNLWRSWQPMSIEYYDIVHTSYSVIRQRPIVDAIKTCKLWNVRLRHPLTTGRTKYYCIIPFIINIQLFFFKKTDDACYISIKCGTNKTFTSHSFEMPYYLTVGNCKKFYIYNIPLDFIELMMENGRYYCKHFPICWL